MNVREGERTAILETEVAGLKKSVEAMDSKLDELLALKSKGLGAVWFASILLGSGFMTFVGHFFDWFKGN